MICAIDRGEVSPLVIERALADALHHKNVNLHIITVVGEEAEAEEANASLHQLVDEILPTFADEASGALRRIKMHTRVGETAAQIVELAYESRAHVIFVGRFGGPNPGRRLGRTATDVVNTAPCTVQVVQVPYYDEEGPEMCAACARVREDSDGERWFCDAHNDGRIPRLMERVGTTITSTPGWGLFG